MNRELSEETKVHLIKTFTAQSSLYIYLYKEDKAKRIKTMCLTKDLRYETDNTINKKYQKNMQLQFYPHRSIYPPISKTNNTKYSPNEGQGYLKNQLNFVCLAGAL